MSLPSYVDLEKSCKDLFSKGYPIGQMKIATAGSTCSGMEIKTNATHSLEEGTVLADIQTKMQLGFYGLSSVCKWNTENLLTKEITCTDFLAQGLTVGAEGKLQLDSGAKEGLLMGRYKIDNATLDISVEGGDSSNLLVNTSVVGGYRNYITGYQVSYDTNDGSLKSNNVVAGVRGSDFTALLTLENMENPSGSYYQKVNDKLEYGVQGSVKGEDGPSLAIGAKYNAAGAVLRGKVDNKSQLGLGCDLQVSGGPTVSFAANIDLKNFSAGGHKIGVGIEFV